MATRTRFKSSSPAPSSLSASTTMTLDSVAAAGTPHPQQTTSKTTTTTTALPPSNFQQQFPPQAQIHHHPYPNAGHLHHHHAHPRGPPPRLDDYVAAKIAPEDPTRRFSSTPDNTPLAILNFHNAVPRNYGSHSVPSSGPVPVVLPPVGGAGGGGGGGANGVGSVGHVLGQPPASSYGAHHAPHEEEDVVPQYRYRKNENSYHHRYAPTEKSRSLSIQSLISSPELTPPTSYSNNDGQSGTRKRKGSDGDVGGSHGTRSGSIVSTTVTMDDPEVREVVEALGGLKGDFTATSPTTANHQLPPHQRNPSGVAEKQQPQQHQQQQPEHEPLINLITSSAQRAHPLISSVITTGLSAYGASKSYSPSFRYAAESVESRVGVPVGNVVSAVGRQTGLDSALRRGLGGNRRASSGGEQRADTKKRKTSNKNGDLQKGEESFKILAQQRQQQQQQNTLARMNGGGDRALDEGASDRQIAAPNQTWPTRVVLSTYGFGAALNEESLKNLKYCLDWLRFLNAHLGKLVSALKGVVEELDDHRRSQMDEGRHANGGIARALPTSYENSRAVLAAKVESLKGDVVATMKKVVEVVSNYTGSALPENARELIKRHIFALPQRFQAANASELAEKEKDGPMSSASRALVLAKEGLDMMQQVSAVVEGTIDRAEEWCERLGRKKREDDGQSGGEEKKVEWAEGGRDGDGDVKMEKP